MPRYFMAIAFGGVAALITTAAQAIEPALLRYNASGPWSSIEYSDFDSLYVNDRHDGIGDERDHIVTQWSRAGLRATVRDYEITGYQVVPRVHYRTVRHYSHRHQRWFYRRVPDVVYQSIPQWTYTDRTPTEIQFVIHGEPYRYTGGPVAPDLAAALASAPPGNMQIRLRFEDGSQAQVEIGAGTVRAWQRVFGEPLTAAERREWEQQREDAEHPPSASDFFEHRR